MEKISFSAPCIFGIEGICADELKRMGIENVRAENGRVLFDGDLSTLARVNLCSRYAERVHILLARFRAYSFEELFQGVKNINWEDWIGKKDAFPVTGHSVNSKLSSIPDCQKIIKKSVVSRLSEKYGIAWFDESGAKFQIRFLIMKDEVSIMLDTSGEGLHKRGYRRDSTEAPIKETLASAMADLSRVRHFSTVVDPFCGSGTILIESALKALNIAPGLRRSFISEKWECIPDKIWSAERERCFDSINRNVEFRAYGYDIDNNALELTMANAAKAGVDNRITVEKRSIESFSCDLERAAVITNPPYGERLLDIDEARRLYMIMGKRFYQRPGYSYTMISPDDGFEKLFGRQADKRRKLYNGMIKCQVYMYFKNKGVS